MNKKKQKKQKININRRVYYKACLYGGVLIVTLVIIISKFIYSTEMSAQVNVENALSIQTEVLANKMGRELMRIPGVGEGATVIVSNIDSLSDSQRISFATKLTRANSHIFKAAITDNEGKGFDSDGVAVDYSKADFYVNSKSEEFSFTENSPIIGRSAYVCSVPCKYEEGKIGNIYLFIEQDIFDEYYDETIYSGDTSYAIIDSNGHIVSSSKGDSVFTAGSNIYSNLSAGSLPTLSLAQIKIRVVKGEKMAFKAISNEENRTIAIAPFGIADWSLVTIVNSDYVENQVKVNTKEARNLINSIVILISIFIALLLVYAVINKIRFNEESADLADKADTDLLTCLNNKMATERKIQEYLDENPGVQCMMFLFDIDNFKHVNDTWGHDAGDFILTRISNLVSEMSGPGSYVARWGGEEFLILFTYHDNTIPQRLEKIRAVVEACPNLWNGTNISVTLTMGVSSSKTGLNPDKIIIEADNSLYYGKTHGKNQVCLSDTF